MDISEAFNSINQASTLFKENGSILGVAFWNYFLSSALYFNNWAELKDVSSILMLTFRIKLRRKCMK